ncbi:MAG: prolyl oligopeptidase family serine peptidase [Planctomycetes bacterium]|nr:prolyl oligopeptidase family serine peptidase [Planctomycetota bacterium]
MVAAILKRVVLLVAMTASPLVVWADGPKDNDSTSVRPVPRPGIEVSKDDELQLTLKLLVLNESIEKLKRQKDTQTARLLPDVEIFYRAVNDNLTYHEFFSKNDVEKAKELLTIGQRRAGQLLKGDAPWTTQSGLVVRGYVSRLDQTVQPYGLVIPKSYSPNGATRFRCDLWFHGRGETLSETNFIHQRMHQLGRYVPADTFVLHPYGRYSNAFKFAGEVDVLEALDSVRERYRIDDDRISVRGFSMGGAACWQFAVHYADRWFAANPGAGFSETPEFLKFFQKETLNPTWYERKLWHWYDCPDYAINLYHCPTVAYSGELDIQKQAADIMEAALEKEGIDLVHIIGPGTKHAIHPQSMQIIEGLMDTLAKNRKPSLPDEIHFATHTLKYNRMHWVTIDGLGEHWSQARVDAEIMGSNWVQMQVKNVTELTLSMPAGLCPLDLRKPVQLTINDQSLIAPRPKSDRSWNCTVHLDGTRWRMGARPATGLRKRHALQGPIDDAFMDSFIVVKPGKRSRHPQVEKWIQGELQHAVQEWRRQFRGDARVKSDSNITENDIASSNLILFGDPTSNAILARIIDRLPITWTAEKLIVGNKQYDAKHHAPVLIYPNPLNPDRYVVLNSGFTYREYDYLNNARQVPKLPDWAIIDLRTPPDSRYPGKIVNADFFGENWKLRPLRN